MHLRTPSGPPSPLSTPQTTTPNKIYTSYLEELPADLSYQSVKLANFIELELADLEHTLQRLTDDNYQNMLKDCLAKSYNVFHEMQKIYDDMGVQFLYCQVKKLISTYGIIFVYLLNKNERTQRLSALNYEKGRNSVKREQISQFDIKVKESIENSNVETKNYKKHKGIHLFNESYARCVDYNIEEFQKIRESMKDKERCDEKSEAFMKEKELKFRKEVIDELNDYSHLKFDSEEVYLFLDKQKSLNQYAKTRSLGDELEQIVGFFKESQYQALEFLKEENYPESFHELTEGFNSIIDDYNSNKSEQIRFVKYKIKEMIEWMREKNKNLNNVIHEKDKEIYELKELLIKKKNSTSHMESQTIHDFDEEITTVYKKFVESEIMVEELKRCIKKINEEDKKEIDGLMNKMTKKEMIVQQMKTALENKTKTLDKLERRIKLLNDDYKSRSMQNPIEYFQNLDANSKKLFFEEMKDQGFIVFSQTKEKNEDSFSNKISPKTEKIGFGVRTPGQSLLNDDSEEIEDNSEEHNKDNRFKKKELNFFKRSPSSGNKENYDSRTSYAKENLRRNDVPFTVHEDEIDPSMLNYSQRDGYEMFRYDSQNKNMKIGPGKPGYSQNKEKTSNMHELEDLDYSQKNLSEAEDKERKNNFKSMANLNFMKLEAEDTKVYKSVKHIEEHNVKKNKHFKESEEKKWKNNIITNKKKMGTEINDIIGKGEEFDGSEYEPIPKFLQTERGNLFKEKSPQNHMKTKSSLKNTTEYALESEDEEKGRKSRFVKNPFSRRSQFENSSQNKKEKKRLVRISFANNDKEEKERKTKPKSELNIESLKQQVKAEKRNKCAISNELSLSISLSNTIKTKEPTKTFYSNTKQKRIQFSNSGPKREKFLKRHESEIIRETDELNYQESLNPSVRNSYNSKEYTKDLKEKMRIIQKVNKKVIDTRKFHINESDNSRSKTQNFKNEAKRMNFMKQKEEKKCSINQENSVKYEELEPEKRKFETSMNFKTKGKHQNGKKSEYFRELIEEEFEDEEALIASRECRTIEEFKQWVMKTHKRCGENCAHLKRYLEIFMKLSKLGAKRGVLKLHVEDMNHKIGNGEDELPIIKS